MKTAKIFVFITFLLAFTVCVSAQGVQFPNELKGYEFFGKGKLKGLQLGVSGKEDILKIFGKTCDFHENEVCEYDNKWNIVITYFGFSVEFNKGLESYMKNEFIDKIFRIELLPKEMINFENVKFSKIYKRNIDTIEYWSGSSNSKPIRTGWSKNKFYENPIGLTYAICIKDSKKECVKDTLNWINYEIPENLLRKYFNIE